MGGLRTHLQQIVVRCRGYCELGAGFGDSGKEFARLMGALREERWVSHMGELGTLLAVFGDAIEEVGSETYIHIYT